MTQMLAPILTPMLDVLPEDLGDLYEIYADDPYLDPIGPHPYEHYVRPDGRRSYGCGYNGCGASRNSLVHLTAPQP